MIRKSLPRRPISKQEAEVEFCTELTNTVANLSAGYQIGSDTIESGCKQIATQRLKHSGARWTLEGARMTAKARAAWLSGQCDQLAALRAALPLLPNNI